MAMVIVDKADNWFWGGTGWTPEYPDALEFMTLGAADKEFKKAAKTAPCKLVENYGFDTVKVVRDSEVK